MNIDDFDLFKLLGKSNIVGKISVRNVLSSHLWLITILLIFFLILIVLKADTFILIIVLLFLLLLIIHFMGAFDHFKKRDPKFLLNESTYLKAIQIEPLGSDKSIVPIDIIEGDVSVESPTNKGKKTTRKLLK